MTAPGPSAISGNVRVRTAMRGKAVMGFNVLFAVQNAKSTRRTVASKSLHDSSGGAPALGSKTASPSEIQVQPWDVASNCGGLAAVGSSIGAPVKPTLLPAKAEAM